ncbi:TB2/DP1, HVA22 family-domain-containing protein [Absidia repens]|uniref:Protein YOP1 n=1 Tax=Absidia repens TaxID=90262 RepID=A0A1X2I859_9FUNG|nr:TB2/DP1, HVA22 family-domain-containing protein [Absidia repens]
MITRPIYVLTKLFFLQLYPAYLSYKSIKHNQQQQQQQQYSPLIIYWMVVSLYLAIEYITDIFLFWFPFYYEIKLVIVLWLLPQTNGTEVFYKQYIDPFLSSHEALIDQTLIDIQAKVKSRVSLYWQNMVQFLRTFISDSFFKVNPSLPMFCL